MQDQYSGPQGQFSDNNDGLLAFLQIAVDSDRNIEYSVNWKPEEGGLISVATILYKLIFDNLTMQILEEIKKQCVLDDNEDGYAAILHIIEQLTLEKEINNDDDNVVIPPDQIFNI